LASKTLLEHGILSRGGAGAIDALAYWTAGRSILDGHPVYGIPVGGFTAYLYPPVLAQLVAPLSAFPLDVFVWSCGHSANLPNRRPGRARRAADGSVSGADGKSGVTARQLACVQAHLTRVVKAPASPNALVGFLVTITRKYRP
jgi:hypothetical protein